MIARKFLYWAWFWAATAAATAGAQLPSDHYALAPLSGAATVQLPALDEAKARAEDALSDKSAPLRYAVARATSVDAQATGKSAQGVWQALPDGRALWRVAVVVPNARSIDLGFTRYFLPHGAELYIANTDRSVVRGPYTDADNELHGQLWTPLVTGERAEIELVVPAELRHAVQLELTRINAGYREFWKTGAASKSGSCNVDVVCPEGDAWREQIRAVGTYGISAGDGGILCTGQLLNNTRGDRAPLFLTANHCRVTPQNAASTVVYWNFQNSTCRAQGSTANGGNGDGVLAQTQTGALFRAKAGNSTDIEASDFALLELDDTPLSQFNVYYSGWDRRGITLASAVSIHHPNGDLSNNSEKRISFENNPLTTTNYSSNVVVSNGTHLRVTDWDLGTTEGGSSGGGLWDANKRLVGWLSGGFAACGNNESDWFGRLAVGWEGTGTADRRLRDWLDPGNTGAQLLDGTGACTPPSVTLNGPSTGTAGQPIDFNVAMVGPGAPFTVTWDVDGDGITDRTLTGVSAGASINVNYPAARSLNLIARVTNNTGCTATVQRALNISAPDIVATAQTPVQINGDGDGVIEPGECWNQPVRLFNAGGGALSGAHAIFAKGAASGTQQTDEFGYLLRDSTGTNCPFNFVDIGNNTALTLTASGTEAPANDDGRTAPQALGPTPFDFYGQTVTQLVMSTNGYLSTAASDSGGDYDNTCGLAPPDRGSSGGRFNVLHDDLVVQSGGGLRRQYFATCPRPGDIGSNPRGCTVFQWTNLGRFVGNGAQGNAEFQAILYDGTYEIVYQYRVADPLAGGGATIGVQNAAATIRSQYACEQNNSAPPQRAVCLLHPSSLAQSGIAAVRSGAIALNNLASGQEQTVNVRFDVGGSCGTPLQMRYVGTLDPNAYSLRATTVLDTVVGAGGSCAAVAGASCGAPAKAAVQIRDGYFANPKRYGNGTGTFTINTGSGPPVFFSLWFTGEADRKPTWYAVQGPLDSSGDFGQVDAPVLRYRQTSTTPFASAFTQVGTAQITMLSRTRFAFTWTVDGVAGGEIQDELYPSPPAAPNRTGAWYPPSESGWGAVHESHRNGSANDEVLTVFLYDGAGNPRWTLGGSLDINGGPPLPQSVFFVHCPVCPNFGDFGNFALAAGSLTRSYSSQTQGVQSTSIVFPAPLSGNWNRTNIPIQMLSNPQQ
jgi:hypothetical protein